MASDEQDIDKTSSMDLSSLNLSTDDRDLDTSRLQSSDKLILDNDPIDDSVTRQVDLSTKDPLQIAIEQGWLSGEAGQRLSSEAGGNAADTIRLALDRGELSAREYDIVSALSGMREVAPGYQVKSLLGRGGMGAVYLAEQINLTRPVALKTILVDAEANDESVQRFEREARTIARLRHPNIITAYDFGRHAGRLFLAMELVEGEDLDTKLQNGPVNEIIAWAIARQIAAALLAAGKLGVIHRDIKPANVLLIPSPEGSPLPAGVPLVKVADFGLAFLADSAASERVTSANVAVGSPHYMAPELLGGSDATAASDLYALGATVYRMLAGEPPFANKALPVLINEKLSGKVPELAKVSAATKDLVARMMSFDVESRPESFIALIAEIDEMTGFVGMSGHVDVAPRVLKTRSDRVSWKLIAASLTVVALTACALVALAPPGKPAAPTGINAPDVEPVGTQEHLFFGDRLSPWTPGEGSWTPAISESLGGNVIVGESSDRDSTAYLSLIITEYLATASDSDLTQGPTGYFRFDAIVSREESATGGIEFNPTRPAGENSERYWLSISDQQARIFRTNRSGGDDIPLATTPISDEQFVAARIEFRPLENANQFGWFVFVNNKQVGPPLPLLVASDGQYDPVLRLIVSEGRCEFAELTAQVLRVVEPVSGEASAL